MLITLFLQLFCRFAIFQNKKVKVIPQASVPWMAFLGGIIGKELSYRCKRCKWRASYPSVGKIPWRKEWLPTPVFLSGEEPGKLQSIASQRAGHNWSNLAGRHHEWIVRVRAQSYLTLCNPMDCSPPASLSMEFSRQEYWSALPFPTPGESSQPRNRTHISWVSCIGRWILYHCATWEAHEWMDWRKQ